MANTFNSNAYPFFAINLTQNFEIEPDELREFVAGMPNWKYIEIEGIDTDGLEVDAMFLWYHSDEDAPGRDYNVQDFVDFMEMAGFDINPNDILVINGYQAFACECNNYAPILPLEDMSRIEGIYGNVDNKQLYVQKAMRRFVCA